MKSLLWCFVLLGSIICLGESKSFMLKNTRLLVGGKKSVVKRNSIPFKVTNEILELRGGESATMPSTEVVAAKPHGKTMKGIIAIWGVLQVASVLVNSIGRMIPIAYLPFQRKDIQLYQWIIYLLFSSFMVFFQGYKGFQNKFAPLVVSRAMNLSQHLNIVNFLFAGPYCMGMFSASRKRIVISWGFVLGVTALAKFVKYLPYPYKSIVDGGVVLGLSYGTTALILCLISALLKGDANSSSRKLS
jgi:hypothetical protein